MFFQDMFMESRLHPGGTLENKNAKEDEKLDQVIFQSLFKKSFFLIYRTHLMDFLNVISNISFSICVLDDFIPLNHFLFCKNDTLGENPIPNIPREYVFQE